MTHGCAPVPRTSLLLTRLTANGRAWRTGTTTPIVSLHVLPARAGNPMSASLDPCVDTAASTSSLQKALLDLNALHGLAQSLCQPSWHARAMLHLVRLLHQAANRSGQTHLEQARLLLLQDWRTQLTRARLPRVRHGPDRMDVGPVSVLCMLLEQTRWQSFAEVPWQAMEQVCQALVRTHPDRLLHATVDVHLRLGDRQAASQLVPLCTSPAVRAQLHRKIHRATTDQRPGRTRQRPLRCAPPANSRRWLQGMVDV